LLDLRPLSLRDPLESLGYDRNPRNQLGARNLADSSSPDEWRDPADMPVSVSPERRQEQLLEIVRQGLAMLPQTDKNLVESFYFEGLTLPMIAARTGEGVVTVRYRFYRAIIKLREFICASWNKELE